ncbi:tail fiber assembly protein [Serratia sp. IR-2025]
MIYFSATTKGFYPTDIIEKERYEGQGSWPDDATEISEADYKKYLSTPPPGMELGSKSGKPAWVVVELCKEDAILIATMKKQQLMASTEEAIAPLSRAEKYGIITTEEKTKLEALERYTVLLSRINPDDAPDIEWPIEPEV